MEAKNADLSALRIDRAADPAAPTPGARRWLVIGLPVAGVVVLAAVLLATSGALGSAVPVRLPPATMGPPMRSGAVLSASGYVVAQRQAAVAQAALQSAQVALENTVIRAPFDGTVLTKNADVGEVVAPLAASAFSKSAVVTIADLRSLQVEADVAESNLEAVSLDQPCEIVLDAYPDVRYPAVVARIVPTADRAKATVQVKVAFRSYDARVLPEMSAKVHFLPRPSRVAVDTQPVLVVPGTAVVERNGRSVVFVVERGRAVEVPVVVGRQVGSSVAIREGLHPGVHVVDSVGARLRGGAKVTVQ